MRIYSQIKDPSEVVPAPDHTRQSQFSFHQSHSDAPRSQISEVSERQQRNKFSFRLQPELYFQRNNQKDKLYQAQSHIRLASSSSESSLRELSHQLKNSHSRKKIFDQSMRVTVLNEAGDKIQQVQAQVPLSKEIQQPPKKVEEEGRKLMSILKRKTQVQQPASMGSNSSFQQSRERSRRNNYRVQFVHEDTDKYLTRPILQEPSRPRMQQPIKQPQPIAPPTTMQASLVEKIERNEQSIKELHEKLNRKIADDQKKNDTFMRMLSQNAQRVQQREQEKQNYEQQMNRLAQQKTLQRERINLQIQQSKRLQQLILENRHLCAKVLQQSKRTPPPPTPDELHIEQRIRELQTMRQNLQFNHSLNQSQSLHLNETIVPTPPLNSPPHLAPTVDPQKRPFQVGYSSLANSPNFLPSNLPTFQMIPERDVSVEDGSKGLRRVVLISKIY